MSDAPQTQVESKARPARLPWGLALLVLGAMAPATIVIPVVRGFTEAGWPGQEWLAHAFMAVNLLGACTAGPLLAARAERLSRRRAWAAALAAVDGLMILLVALMPPAPVMLALRLVQGAASVGAVSLLMGAVRGTRRGAAMGLVGSAVVLAIVLGIALGAILRGVSPALPLYVGGALGLAVALGTLALFPKEADAAPSELRLGELLSRFPALRAPVVVVALERFAVGLFVVTLALHAHHVLAVPDGLVSRWYSAFLITFAVTTSPMARLGGKLGSWRMVAGGASVYAATFLALGFVPAGAVAWLLAAGGLGSAAIYGPCLGLTAAAAPQEARGSAMAVMNAAGTLGMFLGTTLGGLLSTGLLSLGVGRAVAHPAVFVVAGLSQLVSVGLALRAAGRGSQGSAAPG